ncbi:hypothetical protein MMC11_004305 [Xylographa trunciseda]|nr:hypothetical protein [Xylographa trunciseda]
MLTCYACRRSCSTAILAGASNKLSSVLIAHAALSPGQQCGRRRWSQQRCASTEVVAAQRRFPATTAEVEDDGKKPIARKTAIPRAELEKELQHLPDPLKLADHTLYLLRKDEHIKALDIVRHASRTMPCTVSWNHIIDYDMSKGRVTPAMKTYNEMKKRAQPPDAYTYTILLRGLAANHEYPQSLPRALSVYNSMYAENSPVRPSIIHTNAVLKVCSRANDIDALFEVAAKLPKRGRGAPDNMTFTTIINAIWNAALDNPLLSAEQHTVKRREAVQQGRRMWEDIVGRWRDGDMLVDEDMVCAMARLLILGDTPEDFDDVLSLFEQTMNIPRLIPRLGDPNRQPHLTPSRAPAPLSSPNGNTEATENETEAGSQNSDTDPNQPSTPPSFPSLSPSLPPSVFTPLPLTPSSLPRSHPVPSRQTLSALIDACTHMFALQAGSSYWKLLTSAPYSIIPDAENLHMYLRLLRLSRASRHAVAILTSMLSPRSAGGLGLPAQPKTFRIAMSACVRDARNPSAPAHAAAVLAAMAAHLEEPDLRACEMFVAVLEKAGGAGAWRPLVAALDAAVPVVANLRSMLAYGAFAAPDPAPADDLFVSPARRCPTAVAVRPDARVTRATTGAVLRLLRRFVGLYNRLLDRGREAFTGPEYRLLKERRERLGAYVERQGPRAGGPDTRDPRLGGEGRAPDRKARVGSLRGERGRSGVRVLRMGGGAGVGRGGAEGGEGAGSAVDGL